MNAFNAFFLPCLFNEIANEELLKCLFNGIYSVFFNDVTC